MSEDIDFPTDEDLLKFQAYTKILRVLEFEERKKCPPTTTDAEKKTRRSSFDSLKNSFVNLLTRDDEVISLTIPGKPQYHEEGQRTVVDEANILMIENPRRLKVGLQQPFDDCSTGHSAQDYFPNALTFSPATPDANVHVVQVIRQTWPDKLPRPYCYYLDDLNTRIDASEKLDVDLLVGILEPPKSTQEKVEMPHFGSTIHREAILTSFWAATQHPDLWEKLVESEDDVSEVWITSNERFAIKGDLLKMSKEALLLIPVSKRCCPACSIVLKNVLQKHPGSGGFTKFVVADQHHEWFEVELPPFLPENIADAVIRELKGIVTRKLQEIQAIHGAAVSLSQAHSKSPHSKQAEMNDQRLLEPGERAVFGTGGSPIPNIAELTCFPTSPFERQIPRKVELKRHFLTMNPHRLLVMNLRVIDPLPATRNRRVQGCFSS